MVGSADEPDSDTVLEDYANGGYEVFGREPRVLSLESLINALSRGWIILKLEAQEAELVLLNEDIQFKLCRYSRKEKKHTRQIRLDERRID